MKKLFIGLVAASMLLITGAVAGEQTLGDSITEGLKANNLDLMKSKAISESTIGSIKYVKLIEWGDSPLLIAYGRGSSIGGYSGAPMSQTGVSGIDRI